MATTTFLPQALPAKQITISNTTLFHVAARYLGDATQWNRIAELNGLVDPWIADITTLLIPQPGSSNGGILNPSE